MKIYYLSNQNLYTGISIEYKGVPVPWNATDIAPPPHKEGFARQFNRKEMIWAYAPLSNFVPPLPSLDAAKQQKRSDINTTRDSQEQAGFEYMGKVFDSDPTSVQRLTVAGNAAMMANMADGPFSIEWTTQDNSKIVLNADEMMGALAALATYSNALHEKAKALKTRVDAATTVDAVQAVGWE